MWPSSSSSSSSVPQPFGTKSFSSLAGMEDVDSEKQKPLPFQFQIPCLQFTKDESNARIRWQAKGNVVASHKQHMVNTVGKENGTSLYSSWMPSAEAKRKHEALLASSR